MSKVQDVLNSRRTVYKFTKQEVEQHKIDQALLAASNAPCHKHTHPWNFFIMKENIRQELIPTITKLAQEKSHKNNSIDLAKDVQRAVNKIILPPVIIAVASKKTPNDNFREKIIAPGDALNRLDDIQCRSEIIEKITQGQKVEMKLTSEDKFLRLFDKNKNFIGIVENCNGFIKPKRLLTID